MSPLLLTPLGGSTLHTGPLGESLEGSGQWAGRQRIPRQGTQREQGKQGEVGNFAFPAGQPPSSVFSEAGSASSTSPHFEISPSCEIFTNEVFQINYSCHKNAHMLFENCQTGSSC